MVGDVASKCWCLRASLQCSKWVWGCGSVHQVISLGTGNPSTEHGTEECQAASGIGEGGRASQLTWVGALGNQSQECWRHDAKARQPAAWVVQCAVGLHSRGMGSRHTMNGQARTVGYLQWNAGAGHAGLNGSSGRDGAAATRNNGRTSITTPGSHKQQPHALANRSAHSTACAAHPHEADDDKGGHHQG